MHIAFLTPEYPDLTSTSSGGLGTSIKNLAESLVENGSEVSVVIYGEKRNMNFTKNGIHFYLVKQKQYKFGGWYLYRKYLQKFLNELAIKEKIDLIEAADWTGITAFMNLLTPIVLRLHGSDTYYCALEKRKQKWKNRWFEGNALKNADHIISVSRFTGIKTVELFDLKKDYQVIHNGVNLKAFPFENQEVIPNTILYFGSVIRKKGVLELALIFNILIEIRPDLKLIIAGKDVEDIKEKTSTLELFRSKLSEKAFQNFTYLGELEYNQIKCEIEKAALVVLPSFAEAFPMTWLEAMAMGKSLVTSNIGWANEIMIDGVTGFMVNPKEHLDYSEKILRLINDPVLNREMGLQARKAIVDNFNSSFIAKRNIEFYRKVLKSSLN